MSKKTDFDQALVKEGIRIGKQESLDEIESLRAEVEALKVKLSFWDVLGENLLNRVSDDAELSVDLTADIDRIKARQPKDDG